MVSLDWPTRGAAANNHNGREPSRRKGRFMAKAMLRRVHPGREPQVVGGGAPRRQGPRPSPASGAGAGPVRSDPDRWHVAGRRGPTSARLGLPCQAKKSNPPKARWSLARRLHHAAARRVRRRRRGLDAPGADQQGAGVGRGYLGLRHLERHVAAATRSRRAGRSGRPHHQKHHGPEPFGDNPRNPTHSTPSLRSLLAAVALVLSIGGSR